MINRETEGVMPFDVELGVEEVKVGPEEGRELARGVDEVMG